MINKFFELENFKSELLGKGWDHNTAPRIVNKVSEEIEAAMADKMQAAMNAAVQAGVDKSSAAFINDVRPQPGAFALSTASGQTDFSLPPFPMLPKLLKNAKPIKDGSGVYKIIPVGKPGNNKPSMAKNIWDAQKAINVERLEAAKANYSRVAPAASKTNFRTATSKQNASTQWVKPAQVADFAEDLRDINNNLEQELEGIVRGIIADYRENF